MLSAFANCFKIPELRQRIIFTLCVIVVVRIGAAIPCPGINTDILARFFHSVIEKDPNNTVVGLFNLFSGGALENCAVFTLGIIPYISASIMLQLMTAVVPSLEQARPRGRRPPEDHPVHPLRHHPHLSRPGLLLRRSSSRIPKTSQLFAGIDAITNKYGPLVPHPGPRL